ncbi:chitin synthase chs-2-like [Alosa sapidissima]|uniref:chitin synthase chs-2-like n=1 Tax=Alosa sapidissima TaxID=34773 RepID=UPI001C08A16D|nr:chitin synthase chs-2-like [Alosa sapidissima]
MEEVDMEYLKSGDKEWDMEEDLKLRNTTFRKSWDCAREVPTIQDEQKPRKMLRFVHLLVTSLAGLIMFGLAFLSKSSFLILITITNPDGITISTKPYASLFIGVLLTAPSVLSLLKNMWKISFKDSKTPSRKTLLWVCSIDIVVSLGSAVLALVTMPHFDILTNVMILNSIGILSAVFQVIANVRARGRKRFTIISLIAVVLLLAGSALFATGYIREAGNQLTEKNTAIWIGLAIACTFCVSSNWWENYASLFNIQFFKDATEDVKRARNVVAILSSMIRIAVTAVVLGVYVKLSDQEWESILSVSQKDKVTVLSLFAIQAISSALCRWFAVASCKMHAVKRSFVYPMWFVSPTVLASFVLFIWVPYYKDANFATLPNSSFPLYCQNIVAGYNVSDFYTVFFQSIDTFDLIHSDVTHSLCSRPMFYEGDLLGQGLLASCISSWWLGLVLCTIYASFLRISRIQRTRELFGLSLYEAAFIEQSMLLNTKFNISKLKKESIKENEMMTIYLCATMWHETKDEMMKMLISMMRLDKFRPKRNNFKDVSFDAHIYFDDAFQQDDDGNRVVNEYAETLVEVIKEVYTIFIEEDTSTFKETKLLTKQKIIPTTYGGRLQYTLPCGNTLTVHFKDKHRIRHKKRWSQIMYLYYLLGWKLHRKFYQDYESGIGRMTVEENLKKDKRNTYILALDGDTDFQPSAVMLLVDRLRMYPEVGAACGRIHPTGTGPMVWYQKFEYAVGHWLQKSAEHVFGCVLCSPGCFSLFRASALMDDNIMKKYTTTASEAGHYVQYDQGEDRWLCTLLLQQGWRVEYNAASDSYTNAPQEFNEFYNQRRRWGPSTMANTLDLLGSGELTVKKNKSISTLFILYQTLTMGASILGPATVCLMIAGSFSFVFDVSPNWSLVLAIVPPAIYLILCYLLKSNTQITIAAVMSIIYAFLMTASILSIIGDMVEEGTFVTPSGLFFIGIVSMYIITALLHPSEFHLIIYGFLYVLCIPSGYLLLAIYSMVNMNNVSWGTRETAAPKKAGGAAATQTKIEKKTKYEKKCKCCSWNLEFQVNEYEEVKQAVPVSAPQTEPVPDSPKEPLEVKSVSSDPDPDPNPDPDRYWVEQLVKRSGELELERNVLNDDEVQFWKGLQERYLKPLDEDKDQKKRIEKELKELRNKATFVFFICNALWLVATFFLQEIGGSVSIQIPKIYANGTTDPDAKIFIDPIGLMFVIGFALLLSIQFFAMLWHRLQTLIHFIAYQGTESAVFKNNLNKSYENLNNEKNLHHFL